MLRTSEMLTELGIQDLHRIEGPILLPGLIFSFLFFIFIVFNIYFLVGCLFFFILISAVCFYLISAV